ncbi:MAG TPA: hypothetical protein DD429_06795 [Clostridiaceae bacterium]|nr:hypothetical protein [Clostridiaceae bacterium]
MQQRHVKIGIQKPFLFDLVLNPYKNMIKSSYVKSLMFDFLSDPSVLNMLLISPWQNYLPRTYARL